MSSTSNLGIPFLSVGMQDKETFINEGFQRLDALYNTGAISRTVTAPPASPANGDLYIIPAGASGSWSGKTNQIAFYHSNWGWAFTPPREGMQLWVNNEDTVYIYNGSSWNSSGFALPYAAGTFTPSIAGSTVAGTAVYSSRQGNYTRIGNRLFADIYVNYSAGTGSGSMLVSGLPMPSTGFATASTPYSQAIATGTAGTYPVGIITPGSSTLTLFAEPMAGGSAPFCTYDPAGELILSINYPVA